ncbi:unnamed protein product, partial [Trichogramma brassicae]
MAHCENFEYLLINILRNVWGFRLVSGDSGKWKVGDKYGPILRALSKNQIDLTGTPTTCSSGSSSFFEDSSILYSSGAAYEKGITDPRGSQPLMSNLTLYAKPHSEKEMCLRLSHFIPTNNEARRSYSSTYELRVSLKKSMTDQTLTSELYGCIRYTFKTMNDAYNRKIATNEENTNAWICDQLKDLVRTHQICIEINFTTFKHDATLSRKFAFRMLSGLRPDVRRLK